MQKNTIGEKRKRQGRRGSGLVLLMTTCLAMIWLFMHLVSSTPPPPITPTVRPAPPKQPLTIPVGKGPVSLGVNPMTDTVYIANYTDNTVSVIDGVSNTVSSTINVGYSPINLDVNPTTNTIYVANNNDGTVSVIDGKTSTVTATIRGLVSPDGLAVNPIT